MCRAAADVLFRYRMAGLAEGVGDEGSTEPSELDPFRDLMYQGRVQPAKHERDRPAEGRPVERVDKDIKGIWSGRLLAGGREGFFELVVI